MSDEVPAEVPGVIADAVRPIRIGRGQQQLGGLERAAAHDDRVAFHRICAARFAVHEADAAGAPFAVHQDPRDRRFRPYVELVAVFVLELEQIERGRIAGVHRADPAGSGGDAAVGVPRQRHVRVGHAQALERLDDRHVVERVWGGLEGKSRPIPPRIIIFRVALDTQQHLRLRIVGGQRFVADGPVGAHAGAGLELEVLRLEAQAPAAPVIGGSTLHEQARATQPEGWILGRRIVHETLVGVRTGHQVVEPPAVTAGLEVGPRLEHGDLVVAAGREQLARRQRSGDTRADDQDRLHLRLRPARPSFA